jgi:hypothetical protein
MRDYSPLRGLAAAGTTVHLKSTTVMELLDELDRLRAGADRPVKIKRNDYPADFEAAWEVYPTRPGASKRDAYKAWAVRLREGITAGQMLAGAQAYAAYVKATRTEPLFVKQAATFFGPGEHYAADWAPPAAPTKSAASGNWWASDETRLAKAIEVGVGPARQGDTTPAWEARIRAAIDNGGKPPAPQVFVRDTPPAAGLAPIQDQIQTPKQRGFLKDMLKQAQEKAAA